MSRTAKAMCEGCPFNVGAPATEMAYNLGCLPGAGEVMAMCEDAGAAWACHSASGHVCAGYAESRPDRTGLPLLMIEGVNCPGKDAA